MYGQFQNPIVSAAKWFFFGFIIVITMGILLGGNIKEATWLNRDIAAAEAEKIQMEVAHQQKMNEMQEQLAAAETEADIQRIQREQQMLNAQHEHDMQLLALDIANRQRWNDVKINLVIFAGGALSIVTMLGGVILTIAKAIAILRSAPKSRLPALPARALPQIQIVQPVLQREPFEPLESPQPTGETPEQLYDRRLDERMLELTQEKENNLLMRRMKAVADPARVSKKRYDQFPAVG